MFELLEMELKGSNNPHRCIAPLCHGALMELIDTRYAAKLHAFGIRPFTQSIRFQKDTIVWRVTVMNDEASRQIIDVLMQEEVGKITLKKINETFEITSKKRKSMSLDDLLSKYYFSQGTRNLRIQFHTPTSFKTNGKYLNYPDMRLLYQSLMNRFEAIVPDESIYDAEVLQQLVEYTEIKGYQLRSALYQVEAGKIPSFLGQLQLKIHGPMPLVNLVNFLFAFGEYAGVGIKTALGMGAIQWIRRGDEHGQYRG